MEFCLARQTIQEKGFHFNIEDENNEGGSYHLPNASLDPDAAHGHGISLA